MTATAILFMMFIHALYNNDQ